MVLHNNNVYKPYFETFVSNYRRMNVISNFGKIFEKYLKTRLGNVYKHNNINKENEFAKYSNYSAA